MEHTAGIGALRYMQDETDEQLVERANSGQSEAFGELYYRYRDWVHTLAWRFTGQESLAADVVQEVFLHLLGKFPGFTLSAMMTTYLYPVTKHIALTMKASRGRMASVEEAGVDAEARPDTDQDRQRTELAAAMASLPEEQREVVLMRFVDEMSTEETAAALGIAQGTVKSRLNRAMDTLRNDPRARKYFLG
jgi:RNA polymerase sigma-70 factor (ECF subfamily)